jgi:phospholipid-binding lipoprotein MlaA
MRVLPILLAASLLGGCATTKVARGQDPDPLERFNRGVWAFNEGVDKVAIKPATVAYRTVTPPPARRGLSRIFSNLGEPFNAVNNLLQGKPDRALNSLGRFVVNSTIGVGGLADHATDLGLKPTPEDFGQTLARGGRPEQPLSRPAAARSVDGAGRDRDGRAVRAGSHPGRPQGSRRVEHRPRRGDRHARHRHALAAHRFGVDAILESSADRYATARSAYFQRRRAQIEDREDEAQQEAGADDLQAALKDAAETNRAASPAPGTPPATAPRPPRRPVPRR